MEFRRRGKSEVGINIAPLVDVVFLLVIFFAVSTTFLETAGLPLELPTSSSTAKREASHVIVSLTAEGQIGLDGQLIETAQLPARLREALQRTTKRAVVLRADSHARHGDVVHVMDVIREAGAEGLTVDARSAGN